MIFAFPQLCHVLRKRKNQMRPQLSALRSASCSLGRQCDLARAPCCCPRVAAGAPRRAAVADVHLRAERDGGQAPSAGCGSAPTTKSPRSNRWNAGVGPPFVVAPAVHERRGSGTSRSSCPGTRTSARATSTRWSPISGPASSPDSPVTIVRSPAPGGLSLRRGRAVEARRRLRRGRSCSSRHGSGGDREDIVTIARRLKLAAFYVPSMRNGAPGVTDRRSRQRDPVDAAAVGPDGDRAAAGAPAARGARATVTVDAARAAPRLPLRLVCTHFTNMVMHHLWVLSESGRLRQARALAEGAAGRRTVDRRRRLQLLVRLPRRGVQGARAGGAAGGVRRSARDVRARCASITSSCALPEGWRALGTSRRTASTDPTTTRSLLS